MVPGDRQHFGSAGTQVRSPAQHSGLRIWRCCSLGLGRDCSSDLIPGPGTPYAAGWPNMKKIKKRRKKERGREKRKKKSRGLPKALSLISGWANNPSLSDFKAYVLSRSKTPGRQGRKFK